MTLEPANVGKNFKVIRLQPGEEDRNYDLLPRILQLALQYTPRRMLATTLQKVLRDTMKRYKIDSRAACEILADALTRDLTGPLKDEYVQRVRLADRKRCVFKVWQQPNRLKL